MSRRGLLCRGTAAVLIAGLAAGCASVPTAPSVAVMPGSGRSFEEFQADGPLPVSGLFDHGFYVQGSFFPIPKTLEAYAATSQIYGDRDAGFGHSNEILVGANFYPFDTRDTRLNAQYISVNRSPVGSTFGYYTAGQSGNTFTLAYSLLF